MGAWGDYQAHWPQILRDSLDPARLRLRAPLESLVPPARPVYSPWIGRRLHALLGRGGISTLIVTGGETDICVLASVPGAADRGYRGAGRCGLFLDRSGP